MCFLHIGISMPLPQRTGFVNFTIMTDFFKNFIFSFENQNYATLRCVAKRNDIKNELIIDEVLFEITSSFSVNFDLYFRKKFVKIQKNKRLTINQKAEKMESVLFNAYEKHLNAKRLAFLQNKDS